MIKNIIILKVNMGFRIKKYKTEQILESHIIIKEFFDAINEFDYQGYHKLQKEHVVDYCLMKDNKYVF